MAIFGALRQSGHQAGAGAGNQELAAGGTETRPGREAGSVFPVGRQANHGVELIPSGGANPLAYRLGTALSAGTATQSLPSGYGNL